MTEQERRWKDTIYANGRRDYDYLIGVTIVYQSFLDKKPNDHAHCELCWDRISDQSDDLHCGYVTIDGKIWICPDCVSDFKLLFDWIIINDIATT